MSNFLKRLITVVLGGALAFAQIGPRPGTPGASASAASNTVIVTGLDATGATDSTAAMLAAVNALPSYGGTLLIPYTNGYYKMNLVLLKSGVTIRGAGISKQGTGNFLRAYDSTKPVIQVGASTGDTYVKAIHIQDITFDGGNTSEKGLSFQGGAMHCSFSNIHIWNFKKTGLEFTNSDVYPCEYIRGDKFVVESSQNGANGIVAIDPHVAGTGWTTAVYLDQFSVQVSSGPPVTGNVYGGHPIVIDSADIILSNAYIQMSNTGHGLYLKKTTGQTYQPHATLSNINFDNSSGASSVSLTIDTSYDLRSITNNANLITPFHGVSGGSTNGSKTFFVAGHTTGSITSGQNTLTVADTTGINVDRQIQVVGAGASGKLLIANVSSISGSVVTLSTTAGTTVASADVGYGNVTSEMAFKAESTGPFLNAPGISWGNAPKVRLDAGGHKGQWYHTGSGGSIFPFNSTNYVLDMGSEDLCVFQDNGSGGTATSLIRTGGNTVTITMPGSHNTGVGQYVTIDGCKEAGFNGTYVVASVPSSTTLTYTSAGSNVTATGTATIRFDSNVRFDYNGLVLNHRGLYMLDNAGVQTRIMSQSTTNSNFNISTPNATTGQYIFGSGNTQSSTNHAYAFYAGTSGSGVETNYFDASGRFYLVKSSAPSANAAGSVFYTDANGRPGNISAGGVSGLLAHTGTTAGTWTSAAPTGTTSATAVMMGLGGTATLTPNTSTRLHITVSFQAANNTVNDGITCDLRYGTGAAPTNGAAVTGTLVGIAQTRTSLVAADRAGMTFSGVITGLTQGTAYWFDVSALAVTGGTASITGVTITAHEF